MPTVEAQLSAFTAALKRLRLQRAWTLEILADRTALSKSYLSRLESGDRQVSIAAALALCGAFRVSLASLFEPESAEPCIVVRRGDANALSANGLTYWPLSHASPEFRIQPLRVLVPADREATKDQTHDGEEWVYVLGGALTLSLDGRRYELEAGDAAHFDARLPHRLQARGERAAEVLLVAVPRSASAGLRPLSVPPLHFAAKPRVRLGKPISH